MVSCELGTFQALKDTAQAPPHSDWIRLAASGRHGKDGKDGEAGRSFKIRGTYKDDTAYEFMDVVALNGSSFVARNWDPGKCPGPGWQLIASAGKPGIKGQAGPKGEPGEKGERGLPGATVLNWKINQEDYTVALVMSDGSEVPALNLRTLFEQFHSEVG